MPAYNFQRRFVVPILLGKKPHTIRKRRAHPTEVGDMIYMNVGMRTKNCVRFGMSRCVRVEPIFIDPFSQIIIDRVENRFYSKEELMLLANRDGFEHYGEFFQFFTRYGKSRLEMEIIHWDPMQVEIIPGVRMAPLSASTLTSPQIPLRGYLGGETHRCKCALEVK